VLKFSIASKSINQLNFVVVFQQELKNARALAKEPGLLSSAPATEELYPEFMVGSAESDAMMYQPYMRMQLKSGMAQKDAYQLIAKQVSIAKSPAEQQMVSRVWAEVVAPLFDFPTHWILSELRDFGKPQKSFSIVKCKWHRYPWTGVPFLPIANSYLFSLQMELVRK
jgi:hypothetical protein